MSRAEVDGVSGQLTQQIDEGALLLLAERASPFLFALVVGPERAGDRLQAGVRQGEPDRAPVVRGALLADQTVPLQGVHQRRYSRPAHAGQLSDLLRLD